MCERELEKEHNCNIYWPTLLWPSALCLSRSPDAQPEARGPIFLLSAGLLYHIISLTHLYPTVWLPILTELYNSSTSTQSLEWHVWSSSSGNNCRAVQRSLSSSASVYECIMGFYLVPFRQPNPPTWFLSITGHWNVSLPSGASLWKGMFGRVEGQYTTVPRAPTITISVNFMFQNLFNSLAMPWYSSSFFFFFTFTFWSVGSTSWQIPCFLLTNTRFDILPRFRWSFFSESPREFYHYGCTTWTLTKRLKKKLDGNYTRMLRAILNKSCRQHPTIHQLYGHLPPITKTIQVRRTRHAGQCWRSKDELISDVLLWTPHMAKQKQDDQLEHTYSSYVRIRDVTLKTCQKRWMIGRSDERGSGISVLAARHDDDDDFTPPTFFTLLRGLSLKSEWQ